MLEIMTVGGKAKKPLEPKYAAFLDYMNKQSVVNLDLSGSITTSLGSFKLRVDMSKGTLGNMVGSPWQAGSTVGTNTGRAIQHLCPSQAVFERLELEGRLVLLQVNFTSYGNLAVTLAGLNRNGYSSGSTSLAKGVTFVGYATSPSLVYYDSVADELYSMIGSTKAGPTVWTIPA